MDTAWWIWNILFSSIGLAFFVYGKKQKAILPLLCGIALMAYPYFVNTLTPLVAIGVVLVAIPFWFRD